MTFQYKQGGYIVLTWHSHQELNRLIDDQLQRSVPAAPARKRSQRKSSGIQQAVKSKPAEPVPPAEKQTEGNIVKAPESDDDDNPRRIVEDEVPESRQAELQVEVLAVDMAGEPEQVQPPALSEKGSAFFHDDPVITPKPSMYVGQAAAQDVSNSDERENNESGHEGSDVWNDDRSTIMDSDKDEGDERQPHATRSKRSSAEASLSRPNSQVLQSSQADLADEKPSSGLDLEPIKTKEVGVDVDEVAQPGTDMLASSPEPRLSLTYEHGSPLETIEEDAERQEGLISPQMISQPQEKAWPIISSVVQLFSAPSGRSASSSTPSSDLPTPVAREHPPVLLRRDLSDSRIPRPNSIADAESLRISATETVLSSHSYLNAFLDEQQPEAFHIEESRPQSPWKKESPVPLPLSIATHGNGSDSASDASSPVRILPPEENTGYRSPREAYIAGERLSPLPGAKAWTDSSEHAGSIANRSVAGDATTDSDSLPFFTPLQSAGILSSQSADGRPSSQSNYGSDGNGDEEAENITTVHGQDELFDIDNQPEYFDDGDDNIDSGSETDSVEDIALYQDTSLSPIDEEDEEDHELPTSPSQQADVPLTASNLAAAVREDAKLEPLSVQPIITSFGEAKEEDISPLALRMQTPTTTTITTVTSPLFRGLAASRHNTDRPRTPPASGGPLSMHPISSQLYVTHHAREVEVDVESVASSSSIAEGEQNRDNLQSGAEDEGDKITREGRINDNGHKSEPSLSPVDADFDTAAFLPRDVTDIPWHAREGAFTGSTPQSLHSASTIESASPSSPASPQSHRLSSTAGDPAIRSSSWSSPTTTTTTMSRSRTNSGNLLAAVEEGDGGMGGGKGVQAPSVDYYDPFVSAPMPASFSTGPNSKTRPFNIPPLQIQALASNRPTSARSLSGSGLAAAATSALGGVVGTVNGANAGGAGSIFQKMRSIFEQPGASYSDPNLTAGSSSTRSIFYPVGRDGAGSVYSYQRAAMSSPSPRGGPKGLGSGMMMNGQRRGSTVGMAGELTDDDDEESEVESNGGLTAERVALLGSVHRNASIHHQRHTPIQTAVGAAHN